MSEHLVVLTGVIGSMEVGWCRHLLQAYRGELISLIRRELTDLNSVRVQLTTWIRFIQEFKDFVEIDRVEMAFNSRMTEVHQGSDLDSIANGMITHMKTQIENSALVNSGLRFNGVLSLDANFYWLNLPL